MSDYSFMKTGFNNVISPNQPTPEEIREIEAMLALFISNATVNAARYVELSNRNGVTKDDIVYGLRYEVFEFLNNENLVEKINNMNDELDEEYEDEENEENEEDSMIVDDEEIQPFTRISNLDNFTYEDTEFINKMNNYFDGWNDWVPETPLLNILKNAINQT